jgi:predicted secreted protein
MARMSGADLAVQVSTDGTTFTSFGCFRRFSLNRRKDRYDATCASDVNKTYKPGKPDFTVSGEFVFDDASLDVFTAAEGTSPVTLRFIPNDTVTNANWKGSFWVDYTLDAPYDGIVTGTVELAADGAVTRSTTTT